VPVRLTATRALAMPLAAAAAMGMLLAASHHLTMPSLSPASLAPGAGASAQGPCKGGIPRRPFTGIAVNPQITAHVRSFEKVTGTRIGMVEFYNPFTRPFQRWEARQATAAGDLPLVQLNPRHVLLAQIVTGRYDDEIRRYADSVRAFSCPIVISFGHEMNGWWYTWGEPWTTPATFIAAWRHVHDIFAAAGAGNVIWSWDPSHQYRYKGSLASRWFPGNRYVDWVGLDGYLGAGETFAQVFGAQLRNIRQVTRKPVYLAETGVAGGPDQVWQIASLFDALRKYRLAGLVWFDLNRKQPWRLEGRPPALAAYRHAVAKLRRCGSRAAQVGRRVPGDALRAGDPPEPVAVRCRGRRR
jgi:Glycosyl hydrolase family 26